MSVSHLRKNIAMVSTAKALTRSEKSTLIALLSRLREKTLERTDYLSRHLDSVVDCCTLLVDETSGGTDG